MKLMMKFCLCFHKITELWNLFSLVPEGNWFILLAVHYRVMEHLGSLERTQEARVALGYRLGQLLRFFRALQTSRVLHNLTVHAKAQTNC